MPTNIPEKLKHLNQQFSSLQNNAETRFNVNDSSISLMRKNILTKLLDPRRDIDIECGYPSDISAQQFRYLYDREGIAERVVSIYPSECWAVDPKIKENEESDETEFETTFDQLQRSLNLWSYLSRIDVMSGIGRYGVLLLGLDDGKNLSEPVEGISETGEKVGNAQHKLLYLRVFDESLIDIGSFERDESNPRFGQPIYYNITFGTIGEGINLDEGTIARVHWTRVIHVADNRLSSETFGVSRMRPVYNRLYDLRKLLGGSAEMFWKGAFPGYSFEVNPDLGDVELDTVALRAEFDSYSNGLQRYLALAGVQAKSLSPQVANPEAHINAQIKAIAITLGVPHRIFMGSEAAQLASSQDKQTWNNRVKHRQDKYVIPYVIRPFVDRLIAFGILPEVEDYEVRFADLSTPSEEDKARVAGIQIEAISKYVQSGADALVPPMEFLTVIMGLTTDQAEAILMAAADQIDQDMIDEEAYEQELIDEEEEPVEEEVEAEEPIEEEPEEEIVDNALSDIDVSVSDGMIAEAKRGLEWRKEFKRGGTNIGAGRATQIINDKKLSLATWKRVKAYFDRHEVDKKGKGWKRGTEGYPSAGRIAWALWGGDAGYAKAKKISRQVKAQEKK
jgi:hypothetical protein